MSSPNDSLYPRTVYVRVSESEKARIAERARACGLSESRLLARLGTGGAAPPTVEEREDLRVVRLMLARLVSTLNAIHSQDRPSDGSDADSDIASTLRTARSLLRSLGRRLRL